MGGMKLLFVNKLFYFLIQMLRIQFQPQERAETHHKQGTHMQTQVFLCPDLLAELNDTWTVDCQGLKAQLVYLPSKPSI